mmetsp:Transcript_114215/g.317954  ORF Transcript_114215/g.317954 Transcript_114215/m.317954 type:complete len:422 (-) Transcript_114215:674-1939(-)
MRLQDRSGGRSAAGVYVADAVFGNGNGGREDVGRVPHKRRELPHLPLRLLELAVRQQELAVQPRHFLLHVERALCARLGVLALDPLIRHPLFLLIRLALLGDLPALLPAPAARPPLHDNMQAAGEGENGDGGPSFVADEVQPQRRDVVRDLEVVPALGLQHAHEEAGREHERGASEDADPGQQRQYTPLRELVPHLLLLLRHVVHPIQLDVLQARLRELGVVPPPGLLDVVRRQGHLQDGPDARHGQRDARQSAPRLVLRLPQPKGPSGGHKDHVGDHGHSAQQHLRQRESEDACEHGRGPVRASAEDGDLREVQARPPEHPLDGLHLRRVRAHHLHHAQICGHGLADALLLERDSHHLQQEVQAASDEKTFPEAAVRVVTRRAGVLDIACGDEDASEEVHGDARHDGDHEHRDADQHEDA